MSVWILVLLINIENASVKHTEYPTLRDCFEAKQIVDMKANSWELDIKSVCIKKVKLLK